MSPYISFKSLLMPALLAAVLLPSATTVQASTTLPTQNIAATPDNTVMLTVFLKRPITTAQRIESPAGQAGVSQSLPAGRCRSRQLEYHHGHRASHRAAFTGVAPGSSQPGHREHGVGCLQDRILPDIRFHADRAKRASPGTANGDCAVAGALAKWPRCPGLDCAARFVWRSAQ